MLFLIRAFSRVVPYALCSHWRSRTGPVPGKEVDIPPDFFGICVATSDEPDCDTFIVKCLRELRVRCVRIDLSTASLPFTKRFLKRLFLEHYRVCLHLVQSVEEVKAFDNIEEQTRWRSFVAETLDSYGAKADLIEIGSTCNRHKWSGYTLQSYLKAWQIAWEEANKRKIGIAGPNVTDFEPVYNIALLGEMQKTGTLPLLQTDNLFAERAIEPEAFDHKILGRRLAGLVRFNLVRKAQLLNDIASRAGVSGTVCSHVSWSLRRIARFACQIEEKQADYLARYCCLAAASGALKRVYWGPLIGQREGLIDDGTLEYPDIPHVTFYSRANGDVSQYRVRPAFRAFQTVCRFIANSTFKQQFPAGNDLFIMEFTNMENCIHVVWTKDAHASFPEDCYDSSALDSAEFYSCNGEKLSGIPNIFSESPLYLIWPREFCPRVKKYPQCIPGIRFAHDRGKRFISVNKPPWKGVARFLEDKLQSIDFTELIPLSQTSPLPDYANVLRDSRNRVWSVPAFWDQRERIIVKEFKPVHRLRRLMQPRKPTKAQRSWNNAEELLRRGINTPEPIALLYQPHSSLTARSYFICRPFQPSWSVRQAFTAFNAGATRFEGISDTELYNAIARFLVTMHNRAVFFRDLSAGNLLFKFRKEGGIEFALIDTARARFYFHSLNLCLRLCDLVRICHPLHWQGRRILVGKYMSLLGQSYHWFMCIPFACYDWKHKAKNAIKKIFSRS